MTEAGGWGLAIFPLLAFLVAGWFALTLARRFADRRRPHEATWAAALGMYAVASLAMFLGVLDDWTPAEYRAFWLLGAALNVLFLAQGEAYLLAGRRAGHALLLLVLAASALSTWVTWSEPVAAGALADRLPLGREVWGSASPAYQLRWLSWLGYVGLLAGTVWSAWRMRGRDELRNQAAGTLLIALGATIVAIGSGVGAGYDVVPLFSVSLALGISVMFWGFLRAARPRAL